MKKIKRILAIIGIIAILSLYILTLIFALADFPGSKNMLMAAVACTVFVPVLIYAITLVAKVVSGSGVDKDEDTENSSK